MQANSNGKNVVIYGCGKMGAVYTNVLRGLGYRVYGMDIVPERIAAIGVEPWRGEQVVAGFVLTNTSARLSVIEILAEHTRTIFVEKPLALTMTEATAIQQLARAKNLRIGVGYLMNFSGAVQRIQELTEGGTRYVSDLKVYWGKDRTQDTRPSAGNDIDEMTHGVGLVRQLSRHPLELKYRHTGYAPYVNAEAQAKAAAQNPEFPLKPASDMTLVLQAGQCHAVLTSSFLLAHQVRTVHGVICEMDGTPEWAFAIEFDCGCESKLTLNHIGKAHAGCTTNERTGNRIADQVAAFLAGDHPLTTDVEAAIEIMAVTHG
jgi:predicted dehydrogenase